MKTWQDWQNQNPEEADRIARVVTDLMIARGQKVATRKLVQYIVEATGELESAVWKYIYQHSREE
jgi:hypothetical protein